MKPEFMRLRRAFAGTVAALLMATGIVVSSPAMSASATYNTITVTASCTNYVWSINWTIANSERDKAETITSSSDQAIIAVGATIAEGDRYTKSETVSGPMTKKLTISAKWSNGVTRSNSKTIYPGDFQGTCAPPPPADSPSISVAGSSCATTSASDGTVAFTLTGVTKAYTVKLMSGGTTVATTTNSGGNGGFTKVAAGTYTITAAASDGPTATSAPFTMGTCAPKTPDIDLVAQTCRTGGLLGAVTANLSNLTVGTSYVITLYSAVDGELETLPLKATAETFTTTFDGHGPGVYRVKVADQSGGLLTLSGDATIDACDTELAVTVQLQPCTTSLPMNGQAASPPAEREISVVVAGMEPSTVYTVQLVTNDAAHTVIDSTTTPGDTEMTFTHTFTGVPSPGEYRVEVLGGSERLVSEPISAPLCNLTTLAPPEITLNANQCEGVGRTSSPMSASVIELDATRTYYVRVVDSRGTTVVGGDDQAITGVTTAPGRFPRITAPGTYTAQLLIEPGKQLAATSADSVAVAVCLPTLAMTGPGVLVPLGSIAALLLTLGGAVVTGRLRRRMAL